MADKIKVQFREWDCELKIGEYGDGSTALWLDGAEGSKYEGESIATCTVALEGRKPPKGWVFIKEYSENEGMTQALIDAGVIHEVFIPNYVGPYNSIVNFCNLIIK